MTLKMYNILHFVTYIIAPPLTLLCFVIAILLTFMADIPSKNSLLFRHFWKTRVKTKEHRLALLGCTPIGFRLGPYGIANAKLGLCICDDIIQNTVNVLLLDVL